MSVEVVSRLLAEYTVREVMTPVDDLKRAGSREEAKILHTDYDVIPYPGDHIIQGYFQRGKEEIQDIKREVLISDTTGILALPRLLLRSHFYFVLHGNKIVGYIHYSDLNKIITKIPFFAVYQILETEIWKKIGDCIIESDLPEIVGENTARNRVSKHKKLKNSNVCLDGWEGVFYFPEMLKIARFYQLIKPSNEDVDLLKEFRNRAAHGDRVLLDSYSDISSLSEAYQLCMSLHDQILESKI